MILDRIAPTRRPDRTPSGSQRWEELLFIHWTYPLEAVRPLVPSALELDAWEGRIHVGIVPFVMKDIRLRGFPRGTGLDFLETNARTYVVHRGVPGVWFFSLEASSWLAVQAARLGWGLPYHHARMTRRRDGNRVHYTTTRRAQASARLDVRYAIGEPLGPSKPGTLEHFLLERYVLFTERGGRIHEGRVHHVPYPVQRAHVESIDEGLLAAAGLPAPKGPPETAHFASAVDVEVFGPWPATT
jgi:uncharacterized protein YqjF (DUF2071 family)